MRALFSFPDPVNDVSARVVATGVVLLSAVTLATEERWLLVVLAYGFVARTLTGPTLSPLGQVATRVVTPRLPFDRKDAPGPAKRFAQACGALVTLAALVLAFGFGLETEAFALIGLLLVLAGLEAAAGICVGCLVFRGLMALRVVPASACASCADVWGLADR